MSEKYRLSINAKGKVKSLSFCEARSGRSALRQKMVSLEKKLNVCAIHLVVEASKIGFF